MTLALNGTTATDVYLNGTKIDKAYLNGTEVYSSFGTHQLTGGVITTLGANVYGFDTYYSPVGSINPTTVGGLATKTLNSFFAKPSTNEVICRFTDATIVSVRIKIPDGTTTDILSGNSYRTVPAAVAAYIGTSNGATIPVEISIVGL